MDQRKKWREEEERLVARWNAAANRYRDIQVALQAAGNTGEDLELQAKAARDEIDAVRRKIARLKVEFNSGKRY
jgi:hypothetical protein